MSYVDANDLASMREDQADTMMDTCIVMAWAAGTPNSFGEVIPTYTDGSAIACGFDPTGGRERSRMDGTIVATAARVRLPLATVVGVKDRIRITKRYGETLTTPLTFGVVGAAQRGASALVVDLEAVS